MRKIYPDNLVYLAVYVPEEHMLALKREADKQFSTRSAVFRQILAEWVRSQEGK